MRGLGVVGLGNQIHRLSDGRFVVKSQSGQGSYMVSWHRERWTCDCADYLKGHICKHIEAVRWALRLPLILSTNSRVTAGSDSSRSGGVRPFVLCNERAVSVDGIIACYRRTLACMGDIADVYPDRLPHPKLTAFKAGGN